MRKILNVMWRAFALLTIVVVIAVNGCNSGSGGPSTPKIPDQHENMKEEPAYSKEFWALSEEGFFKMNIPRAGDYKAQYTTNVGSFEILFRLSSKSLVTVELKPGNVVQEVILQRGAIVVNPSQALEIIEKGEFTLDESFGTLVLISGGAIVQSRPTPTPTPTPQATANPIPPNLPTPSPDAGIIVAIGDSITYGKGSSVGGYPAYLQAKVMEHGRDFLVINRGVPGERTSSTNSRFLGEIQGASTVLLMIGTNDLIAGECDVVSCEALWHISDMMDKAVSAGVRLIVSTVPPAQSTLHYANYNDEIDWFNSQLRSIASGKGIRYIDSYLLFRSDVYFSDSIHPNDAGYERIAIEWLGAL